MVRLLATVRRHAPRRLGAGAIGGGVLVLLAGGVAVASIPDSNGAIYACYTKSTGTIRVIDNTARSGVAETEKQLRDAGNEENLVRAVVSLLQATSLEEAADHLQRVSADQAGIEELRVVKDGALARAYSSHVVRDRLRLERQIGRDDRKQSRLPAREAQKSPRRDHIAARRRALSFWH